MLISKGSQGVLILAEFVEDGVPVFVGEGCLYLKFLTSECGIYKTVCIWGVFHSECPSSEVPLYFTK